MTCERLARIASNLRFAILATKFPGILRNSRKPRTIQVNSEGAPSKGAFWALPEIGLNEKVITKAQFALGACALTTMFLDNHFLHFQNYIAIAFLKEKTVFLNTFPLCPRPISPQHAN